MGTTTDVPSWTRAVVGGVAVGPDQEIVVKNGYTAAAGSGSPSPPQPHPAAATSAR